MLPSVWTTWGGRSAVLLHDSQYMLVYHRRCIESPYEVHVVILGDDHVQDGCVGYHGGECSDVCWVSHPVIPTREQRRGDVQLGQVIVGWFWLGFE